MASARCAKNGYVISTRNLGKCYYVAPQPRFGFGDAAFKTIRELAKEAAYQQYGLPFPNFRTAWEADADTYEHLHVMA